MLAGNYTGCTIFIYDTFGNMLAKATVAEHSGDARPLVVYSRALATKSGAHVSVLIAAGNVLHEYSGRLRTSVMDGAATEILLFQGKVKESRAAKRYNVNTEAFIHAMVFGGTILRLLHPLKALIVNLSTSGVLISTPPNYFMIGHVFKLVFAIEDNSTTVFAKVVRITGAAADAVQYGCAFVAIDEAAYEAGGDTVANRHI